jgi:hypothetical protein
MYSAGDTPKGWVAPFGYPRIKACSQLPMAFRSVPRPSSPPGAKASTECPSHAPCVSARPKTNRISHHAQEPSPLKAIPAHRSQSTQHFTNASDHCHNTKWDDPRLTPQSLPVRQITQCRNGQISTQLPKPRQRPSCPTHPEAHQNQIYNTKEPSKTHGTHQHTPRSRGHTRLADRGTFPMNRK